MGEFKECYMWIKLAFLAMALGFACDLFGFAIGMGDEDQVVTGLLIAGLVLFLIAFVLALVVTFFDEATDSKIVKGCLILFAVAAGKR